uniref:Uncharacterized protein n=1 Tax=Arundo donax TaxID=35708 RepID=A0A0A9AEC9_ARUDO
MTLSVVSFCTYSFPRSLMIKLTRD